MKEKITEDSDKGLFLDEDNEDYIKTTLSDLLEELDRPVRLHTDAWIYQKIENIYCSFY